MRADNLLRAMRLVRRPRRSADQPVDLHEGALARARQDARLAYTSVPFVIAVSSIGLVAGALGVMLPANTAAVIRVALGALSGGAAVLVVALLVFMAAWVTAPIRQRNEARREAIGLQRLAEPEFPPHKLTMKRLLQLTLPDGHADAGKRIMLLPIEFTNRDSSRRVSLDFEVVSTWRELGPHKIWSYRGIDLPDIFPSPLPVDPQTHVRGELCLERDHEWLFEPGEPDDIHVRLKSRAELTLRVTDHVTGATVKYPVPRGQGPQE